MGTPLKPITLMLLPQVGFLALVLDTQEQSWPTG